MTRTDTVLAALAAGGPTAMYGPVQVQKLMFLIDREVAEAIGGPFFYFRPYDYGPFDRDVYSELERLQGHGYCSITALESYRQYSLTPAGFEHGTHVLSGLQPQIRDFIERAASWVRSVSFGQLVSAIYQHYPEMKANSIFRG